MFRGPPGVAVPTILPRLSVLSVHPPVFGISNRSPLMPSTLRGKPDVTHWQSAYFETTISRGGVAKVHGNFYSQGVQ